MPSCPDLAPQAVNVPDLASWLVPAAALTVTRHMG